MKGGLGWMKNIGNDPRSLFNGNHFSSLCSYYNPRAKLEFGEITACILYVRSDTIYIYIARLIIEHHRECLASLAD